jgi:histidyl-tRNA synthetase
VTKNRRPLIGLRRGGDRGIRSRLLGVCLLSETRLCGHMVRALGRGGVEDEPVSLPGLPVERPYCGPRGRYDVYRRLAGTPLRETRAVWAFVESGAATISCRYILLEVRRRTGLSRRCCSSVRRVGEASDIVRRRCSSSRTSRELALRPEGTAGVCVPTWSTDSTSRRNRLKLFTWTDVPPRAPAEGPLQAAHPGRGRVIGSADPLVDVEVISLLYGIHQALGVRRSSST